MTERLQIYKCEICGNIIAVLHSGADALVCCGTKMKLLEPKGAEQEGKEKHVPVLESSENNSIVKIGSIEHPMSTEHYIEWIAIETIHNEFYIKFLVPEDKPQAEFPVSADEVKAVYAYCNIHRLWKQELK